MSSFFVSPTIFIGGAALIASPIIIHLINRLRYRRVRFAAMEFLLQSQQRNRRRLLIEQLILLFLRILLVLLLAAILARLILDPEQMSLFQGAQIHHIVLLDDSGSMRDRSGETTAFDDGLEVVRKIVSAGARQPGTQRFTLVLLSHPEQPVFSDRELNDEFQLELETKLENQNLRPTHQQLDLTEGLEQVKKRFDADKGSLKQLHVVSDFRASDWQQGQSIGSLIQALDTGGVTVNLVRTVGERHQNLAITELSGDVHVAAANVPVRLKVAVQNLSKTKANNVRLAISTDGEKLPLSRSFEEIEPEKEVTQEFDIVFDTPGQHMVSVGLEQDALGSDNVRYLAVNVAPANPVLIIDGDPGGDEGSFVADALAADPSLTGYAPIVEAVDYLRRHPLDQFQTIFMLNVPELPEDEREAVRDYVAAGGGLAWFLGENTKPAAYNDKLYDPAKGGLFPVPLAPAWNELSETGDVGGDITFARHPTFRVFEGQDNPFIDSVRIRRYFPVADDFERNDDVRQDGVRTIATLRNGQPIMFEKEHGEGTIIACLTSAGPIWNSWARNPSYVVYVLELERYLARDDRVLSSRLVGEPIVELLDQSEFIDVYEVQPPTDDGPVALKATQQGAEESEEAARLWLAEYENTDAPGVYVLRLTDQAQQTHERWFTYNVPIRESDLELVTDEEIVNRIGPETRVAIQPAGSLDWVQSKEVGQEVRRVLLILLLICLVAEQALAYRLSYHTSSSSSELTATAPRGRRGVPAAA